MIDFFSYLDDHDLTLTESNTPDGSCDIDGRDPSWGFTDIVDITDNDRLWTVLDCDGVLVVVHGRALVNRMWYFVTDQPHTTDIEEFEY